MERIKSRLRSWTSANRTNGARTPPDESPFAPPLLVERPLSWDVWRAKCPVASCHSAAQESHAADLRAAGSRLIWGWASTSDWAFFFARSSAADWIPTFGWGEYSFPLSIQTSAERCETDKPRSRWRSAGEPHASFFEICISNYTEWTTSHHHFDRVGPVLGRESQLIVQT